MSKIISPLEKARKEYKPKLPSVFAEGINSFDIKIGESSSCESNPEDIKKIFPKTFGSPMVKFQKGSVKLDNKPMNVGVILSGGQAPGGHNVIAGIFDALKEVNSDNKLYGFLGGPSGIIDGKYIELTSDIIDQYRNTGGFDIIGSGRTKLEKVEQFEKSKEVCQKLGVKAVVIIGGDDSNTNAALLAEYFVANNIDIQVIGVPKTIDGDLKNQWVEASFGFDTCSKVYSELIGNLLRDVNSAKKYWHFIRLMGRSASHITLECALKCQPNLTLISEEVAEKNMSLNNVVDYVLENILKRSEQGKNFGIILVPEGLIEFIPEMKVMIRNLNDSLAKHTEQFNELKTFVEKIEFVMEELNEHDERVFGSLPLNIQEQLLEDRDPHGNVQVSKIETEKLLIQIIKKKLDHMKLKGEFKGKFSPVNHFFGYEGRCAPPSNFDADYTYVLGYNAVALIRNKLTGYISAISKTIKPVSEWEPGGIPLTQMICIERRHGKDKPVIKKALVELNGQAFAHLQKNREHWALNEDYTFPGPIQYWGPSEVCDATTITLQFERAPMPVS
ncbi:MAG: diphosphate--fructose-6-phosphate 1-phosphotransferase [Cyanobacteriota bacterium]